MGNAHACFLPSPPPPMLGCLWVQLAGELVPARSPARSVGNPRRVGSLGHPAVSCVRIPPFVLLRILTFRQYSCTCAPGRKTWSKTNHLVSKFHWYCCDGRTHPVELQCKIFAFKKKLKIPLNQFLCKPAVQHSPTCSVFLSIFLPSAAYVYLTATLGLSGEKELDFKMVHVEHQHFKFVILWQIIWWYRHLARK